METFLYLALFGLAMFVMMRFGCGAHAMGHGGHRRGAQQSDNPLRWVAPEKDRDPVCGVAVDTADAKSAVYAGDVYYFCSSACRDKFEGAPGSYAGTGSTHFEHKEHRHGCC